MRQLAAFGRFWYDFVVGDDWRVAIGVVIGLAATWLLAHQIQVTAWWLLPLAVATLLTLSLYRAVRTRS